MNDLNSVNQFAPIYKVESKQEGNSIKFTIKIELNILLLEAEDPLPLINSVFRDIQKYYSTTDRIIIKEKLKALYGGLLGAAEHDKFVIIQKGFNKERLQGLITLIYYRELAFYAYYFEDEETYSDLIEYFQTEQIWDTLNRIHPVETQLQYSHILISFYNFLKKKGEPEYNIVNYGLIAKYYLFRIYFFYTSGKIKLDEKHLTQLGNLFSLVIGQFSRWIETFYYLDNAAESQSLYLKAHLLDSFAEKTCLDRYIYLLLSINDIANKAISSDGLEEPQIEQLKKIINDNKTAIKDEAKNITQAERLKRLVSHYIGRYIIKTFKRAKLSNFEIFCKNKQLYLNEHYIFCPCKKGRKDNLNIETSHPHTKIEWVKRFSYILEIIKADFILARRNFYLSQDGVKLDVYPNAEENQIRHIKNSLLKNAFKICYSILDQIGFGVLEAMEKDYQANIRRIDFLNLWKTYFSDDDYNSNMYLISLYSISMDLTKNDDFPVAALREFKDIRNSMEHQLFFIENNEPLNFPEGATVYNKQDLLKKTDILMMLTKSAIHSFVYLIRRASIIKHKSAKDHDQ